MRQYDDHTWIVAQGRPWAIREIQGPIWILWRGHYPDLEYSLLDVSEVNWTEYCDEAVKMLKRRSS